MVTAESGSEPDIGSVLGQYRLDALLGEGGMGRVFRAQHVRLGRDVALKLLRREYAASEEAVRRFFAEARAVNTIKHRNIVEISDFVEDGQHRYAIMELLEGDTLDALHEREGRLPLARAVGIARQVAQALVAAHRAGVVHRDLKPSNIFVVQRDGGDFIKLLDFGVAKLSDPFAPQSGSTAGGAVLGTPEYMAPEQLSGKPVDARADIYAFGVILYELVTGENPFAAESFGETVVKQLTLRVRELDKLARAHPPPLLEGLIEKCLEKDPALRPASMADVEAALAEGAVEVAPGAQPKRRAVAWVAAAAAAVAAAVALLWHAAGDDPPAQHAPPEVAGIAETPTADERRAATIEIVFDSIPPGAGVFMAAAAQKLGTTPVSLAFDRAERTAIFELRKAGYMTATQSVSLARDGQVMVALAADQASSKKKNTTKRSGGRQKVDRRGTLDPFKSP